MLPDLKDVLLLSFEILSLPQLGDLRMETIVDILTLHMKEVHSDQLSVFRQPFGHCRRCDALQTERT